MDFMGRSLFAVLAIAAWQPERVKAEEGHCGLYEYRARIIDVLDGDTVEADIDLGFKIWLRGERLRLLGINAPEMEGESREKGFAAKDALELRVEGQMVTICTSRNRAGDEEREKYGRWLATIWFDGDNVNAWMLEKGFAVPMGK